MKMSFEGLPLDVERKAVQSLRYMRTGLVELPERCALSSVQDEPRE